MRTRRGLCYPRVVEDKNMRVVKRRRDFAAEQVSYRKRSRNSSDIAGKRDLFDSLPDDLVISILCKLSSSATCPIDFANVLLMCRRLNGLVLIVDWRSQLKPDSRQRIVNKIMETLMRHLLVSGQEGLHELRKIAIRLEEKVYTAATSQSDYLRKMSLIMLTMETKFQNPIGNALPSNSAGNSNKSPDAGGGVGAPGGSGGEAAMDSVDWRSQLQPDSRQRIVNKIMETLKIHLPVSGQEGLHELGKIAVRFEEKIYTVATSQSDYLRKIALKMHAMELYLNF